MGAELGSSGPFIGRHETVELLHRRFGEARAGSGGVTLLLGDAGVGKSMLIDELTREVRTHGVPVLLGRAPAVDDPPPFSLLRSAIDSVHDDPAFASATTPPFTSGPVVLGFAPRAGDLRLPPLVGVEQRLLEALATTDERRWVVRDQALSAIADEFAELAGHGPVVLVLEDLHRADAPSLAAVETLASRLERLPVWILATSRSLMSLSAPGRARLEEFESTTHAEQVVLHPMTREEAAEFLRVRDPSRELSPEEVARRFSEAGGNPLLLEQFDRRPPATPPRRGRPEAGLETLDAEAQRSLEVASVLGPEFRFELLLRASGEEDEERFTEVVDRLVGHGLLLERPGEVLAFPDDRLREEVYGHLSVRRRETLHWSVGETLEAMGSAGVSTTYALARHFYLGRARGKSVRYNRLAAEIAERALAPEVARTHLVHALESQRELASPEVDRESELVLELARVTEELGHLVDAEKILREFLTREQADPRLSIRTRATLEVFHARVLADQGEMPAAIAAAKKVLATPGLEPSSPARVGGHHLVGMALYYQGEFKEALSHHTEEIRLARQGATPRVVLLAQIWRLADLAMMGPTDAVVAEAREVTAARDRLGSARESAQAHLMMGDLLADARCTPAQRAEALEQYAEVIRFAEEANDPRRVGWALYKSAELLRETARLDEAAEKAESAFEILDRVGDRAGRSLAVKVRGQVAADRGAFEQAATDLEAARNALRELNRTLEELDVLLRLAQLALARGDREDARRRVAELTGRNLSTARPDLVPEFEKLKHELGLAEDGRDAS